jgi:hypothetical protein
LRPQPKETTKAQKSQRKAFWTRIFTDEHRLDGTDFCRPQGGARRFAAGGGFCPTLAGKRVWQAKSFPLSGIAFACERWTKTAAKVRAIPQPLSSHKRGFVEFV